MVALFHRPDIDMERPFDPVAAMQAYHAAIEKRDLKYIGTALAHDAVYQSKGLGPVSGRDAILAAMQRYFAKYPDNKAWDTSVAEESRWVAVCEWQLRATDLTTGKPVSRRGKERVSFGSNGLIKSVEVEDIT